jgi:hypothetical protein
VTTDQCSERWLSSLRCPIGSKPPARAQVHRWRDLRSVSRPFRSIRAPVWKLGASVPDIERSMKVEKFED